MDERNTIINKQETNENDAFISIVVLAICVCGFITLAFITVQARGCSENTERWKLEQYSSPGRPISTATPTATPTVTPTAIPREYYLQ